MEDTLLPGMSFEGRNTPGGIYPSCYDDFSFESDSLSQLEYCVDFQAETNPWPPNRFATRFFQPSNPDDDLVVTLFGEVLDERDGTGLGAKGASSLKRTQSETVDALKIKDVLALGAPTGADQALTNLFMSQITGLGKIVKELKLPGEKGIKRIQWVGYKSGGIEPRVISVNLPCKYIRPSTKLQKRTSNMDVSSSKSDQISMDSTYDPERMSDFDCNIQLGGARLAQQPLFDENAKLVPPWQAPFVFRKGALVAVEAHLSVYHFLDDPRPSHLYQIAASRVKLLAPSPVAYKPAQPPPPRKKVSTSRSAMFEKMLNTSGGAANANA